MEHEQRDPFAQRDNDDVGTVAIRALPAIKRIPLDINVKICFRLFSISGFSLQQLSDWDRYAAQEYELLVAEEGGDTQG